MLELKRFKVHVDEAILAGQRAGSGPPIVFLHAGVADRRMWWSQLLSLSNNYDVIIYDRRGFGETTAVDEPFSHVNDLVKVLDDLGLETVSLVGCSQGDVSLLISH